MTGKKKKNQAAHDPIEGTTYINNTVGIGVGSGGAVVVRIITIVI